MKTILRMLLDHLRGGGIIYDISSTVLLDKEVLEILLQYSVLSLEKTVRHTDTLLDMDA